jgi:hypothetical protein
MKVKRKMGDGRAGRENMPEEKCSTEIMVTGKIYLMELQAGARVRNFTTNDEIISRLIAR